VSGVASPFPTIERLPDRLPAGRPRVLHCVATQRMAQIDHVGPPARLTLVLRALEEAARALWDARGERVRPPARTRWRDPCDAGRRPSPAVLGVPIPEDACEQELAALAGRTDVDVTLTNWHYGLVGCVAPMPGALVRSVEMLRRHVREQGFGIAPDSYEELCDTASPLRDATLLLFRLERFY
jgi:hypothetical protein